MASPAKPSFTFDASLAEWDQPAQSWLAANQNTTSNSNSSPPWTDVATSAVIYDPRGRVLLQQRAPHDSMPLLWEPPGGAVDAGETILQGCAREVAEESGLAVRHVRRLVARDISFPNRDRSRWMGKVVFEVLVDGGEGASPQVTLDPNEHVDWLWATEEDVRTETVGDRKIALAGEITLAFLLEAFRLRRQDGEDRGGVTTGR